MEAKTAALTNHCKGSSPPLRPWPKWRVGWYLKFISRCNCAVYGVAVLLSILHSKFLENISMIKTALHPPLHALHVSHHVETKHANGTIRGLANLVCMLQNLYRS